MNHNNHVKEYYRLLQNRISDCTLEPTERMDRASYYGWTVRFTETKARIKYIRAVLALDSAVDKWVQA